MTGTQDPSAGRRAETRLLLEDLTVIAGTLSEIATTWRRARPYLPGLPLSLPVRLRDTARQLAAEIEGLADAGSLQPSVQLLSATGHFFALEQGIAAARAMTRGPGIPEMGDGTLWESVSARLRSAEAQITRLGPRLVAAGG
jgi:hypothetical protein